MKYLRKFLGIFVLLFDRFTPVKALPRSPDERLRLRDEARDLALYHYPTCPFCVKVRRELRRLSVEIEVRDAQFPGANRDALLEEGGQVQVPCLRIGNDRWLYESDAIITYLRNRFSRPSGL